MLTPKHKVPMEITTTAEHPFDRCYLDTESLTCDTREQQIHLNIPKWLSKYVVAVRIGQQDAVTVARAFVANIVLKYGKPRILQTDQGANFISQVLRNTCKILEIKKIQSTAFHPESQESTEGSHRVLVEYLRHYVNEDQTNGFLSRPTCTITLHIPPLGLPPLNCCSDAPPLTLHVKEAA